MADKLQAEKSFDVPALDVLKKTLHASEMRTIRRRSTVTSTTSYAPREKHEVVDLQVERDIPVILPHEDCMQQVLLTSGNTTMVVLYFVRSSCHVA